MDNQVVDPEVDPVVQEGEQSGNNEERDVKPSTTTLIVEDTPKSFEPKVPYPERLQIPTKEGSLRRSWRCSSTSKSISHFWTPSRKYHHMPSS